MKNNNEIKVALIGNPNTGKTSIFNLLTGLNQKVGNYPGITVDKKVGVCKLSATHKALIYDLPGTYSVNPNSLDEKITIENLLDKNDKDAPDVIVLVADVENLKQNLLLFTQIKDLRIPTILLLNMADRMKKRGISINIPLLEQLLHTKAILVSSQQKTGIEQLKEAIINYPKLPLLPCIDIRNIDRNYFEELHQAFVQEDLYKLWLIISQNCQKTNIPNTEKLHNSHFVKSEHEIKRMQQREMIIRYQFINNVLKQSYVIDKQKATGLREKLDRILLHKVYGYLIFAFILLVIFQAIYHVSQYPTQWINNAFGWLKNIVENTLPQGAFTLLLSQGILSGIEGVVVFVPQIAFLFLFISILEESGYMSRVVFLMDRIMRPFGLSGKSVIPLMSGVACAVPAVMATRNIENWKERLISILVTPFVTCSARLPVYLIIIELVIPQGNFLFFGYKGLTLLLLYFLGIFMAIFSAWGLSKILTFKKSFQNHFVIEMPNYKMPLPRNIFIMVFEKTKSFVWEAGRIILSISVIIWFLQKHGFSEQYKNAETHTLQMAKQYNWDKEQQAHYLASYQIDHSLLGNIGKAIEPIFKPLGYDWKISIGVICSFGAREAFVGTMATIYSLGEDFDFEDPENQDTIVSRMREEKRADGSLVYDFATGISLLLFYVFAMQCLSTLAIVKRETNSWKWPIIQWIFMTGFAYIIAFVAYQSIRNL